MLVAFIILTLVLIWVTEPDPKPVMVPKQGLELQATKGRLTYVRHTESEVELH